MNKKLISVILAVSILFSVFTVPAFANEVVTDRNTQKVYTVLDKIVNGLVGGIAAMIKGPAWPNKSDYKPSEYFYKGLSKDEYRKEAGENDAWQMGYSNASILTGKEIGSDGDYYVGGSLQVTKKLATEQWDDQKVRTVALSDGRGISIFTAIDAYGLANTEVKVIREKFAAYAKEKKLNITSVNISVLHQHSCVDTFGLNGDIVNALFTASIRNLFGQALPSGKNKDYMNNLYNVTVKSMADAVENMKTGSLYFGKVNAEEYIRDKRDPQLFDKNLNRFRFVPDEGGREIWLVNAAIHCVGNGAGGTALTGDYPYYMEKYINEHDNADLFFIEGAELAISSKGDNLEIDPEQREKDGNIYEIKLYGETLAKRLETIKDEIKLDPIFNISYTEVWIEIENNILVLAGKGGLIDDNIYRDGIGKFYLQTEVGYAEFGKDIAVSIIPGELAPEIAYGGAEKADTSWQGADWGYPSFAELSPDRYLLVFGLTNDQVGYLLTSNNWHSIFTENEEVVSCGQYAGESVAKGYIELVKSVK